MTKEERKDLEIDLIDAIKVQHDAIIENMQAQRALQDAEEYVEKIRAMLSN